MNFTSLHHMLIPQAYAGITNPLGDGTQTLGAAIGALVTAVITLSGVVAIGFLVYGGFIYITSGGDEKQIARGKQAMFGGVAGLVIVMLSVAIVQFILRQLTPYE